MVTSLSASAQAEIQHKLDEYVQTKKVPGFVFGVTSAKGELFWALSGVKELGNPDGGPLTPESVFWICSQTKMITAIAALQLFEEGKLSLDAPAAKFLPALANPVIVNRVTGEHRPAKNSILVRHLFNHTSGLGYGLDQKSGGMPSEYLGTQESIQNSTSREEAIDAWFQILKKDFPGVPLDFEPGTSWQYSFATDVLGFIVERISGKSLNEVFKQNIFDPIGLSSTSFYLTPNLENNHVKLAVRTSDGENVPYDGSIPLITFNPEKVKLNLGGVGLFSTPKDYLALERHLLQILDGTAVNPILRAETLLKHFFKPSLSPEGSQAMDTFFGHLPPGQQHGLGLGVEVIDKGPDHRKAGTGYWSGWAGTSHYIDPTTGIAVYGGFQLAPPPQTQAEALWEEIELILYRGLS